MIGVWPGVWLETFPIPQVTPDIGEKGNIAESWLSTKNSHAPTIPPKYSLLQHKQRFVFISNGFVVPTDIGHGLHFDLLLELGMLGMNR